MKCIITSLTFLFLASSLFGGYECSIRKIEKKLTQKSFQPTTNILKKIPESQPTDKSEKGKKIAAALGTAFYFGYLGYVLSQGPAAPANHQ